MKIKQIIIFVIIIGLSFVVKQDISKDITSTLFTVMGIMFSVGMGLIVSFNFQGIKNEKFVIKFRESLNSVRNNFITYFIISIIFFILNQVISKNTIDLITIKDFQISINLGLATNLIIIYAISYYIINFSKIQKLGYDIFDNLNKDS